VHDKTLGFLELMHCLVADSVPPGASAEERNFVLLLDVVLSLALGWELN